MISSAGYDTRLSGTACTLQLNKEVGMQQASLMHIMEDLHKGKKEMSFEPFSHYVILINRSVQLGKE